MNKVGITCHEIFAFMAPLLAQEILEDLFTSDKITYRAALNALAEARKVRPVFLERQPRSQRHTTMLAALGTPRMENSAASLLRAWLIKSHAGMVTDFLDNLGIAHEAGAVENLPATVDDAKLKSATEALLAKYSHQKVAVYLHAFYATNDVHWTNLAALLREEKRLQLG